MAGFVHAAELEIPRPPALVYALCADPEALATWSEDVTAVEREAEGPARKDETWVLRRGRRASRLRIVAAEPPHRFAWETDAPGTRLLHDFRFEIAKGGTATRATLRLEARLSWILRPFLASFRRHLEDAPRATLERLREAALAADEDPSAPSRAPGS